ncbi:MAG TPA: tRNA 2-thiocytidine(32) synthetase TtcA [Gammaproteobacteria bacterium]|nr:tRNA 2-thiocytidine(32) synthetase TtcA [Gammaproteobacteria bacterium]
MRACIFGAFIVNAANGRKSVNQIKLAKRLRRQVGQAIQDFNMIEAGDRVMVCLSGGKDSYTLLDVLLKLKASAPVEFEILAVNLDQKQPGFPEQVLPKYLTSIGVPFHILEQDTYSVVKRVIPEGKTTCSLCSRLRRGALYTFAAQHGITKIALGHHRGDIIETFFLNLFYAGKLKAMPPKLLSDDNRHVVIRPLAYVEERDIAKYAAWREFPIIPCNLCGAQEHLQRKAVKAMLAEWERMQPGRMNSIFAALRDVVPSHLVDPRLFDFNVLGARLPRRDWLAAESGGETAAVDVLVATVPVGELLKTAGRVATAGA